MPSLTSSNNTRQHVLRWFLDWGPVLVWMALIFALSSQPSLPRAPVDALDVALKKLGHGAGYAVLAVLLCRALHVSAPHRPSRQSNVRAGIALVAALGYAVSDEIHQLFVPGRGASAMDVGIDLLGAVIGILAYVLRSRSQSQSPRAPLC